ncbi:abortive infection system antitoxin AbiGi family protein [Sphingopyxis yananensis]|uniref:abortive infection system antitoxin AbiGi family protein n=1 Tax=Sphingopyxis yananensis TaxID=2886687 RepID=UPI001D129B41|nr:abortive infection system antitoxin AbiGi family protein [Sphingopyxis yananensis]MCC2603019.1 hypothetical protein [Sphingopyxis yananensis]
MNNHHIYRDEWSDMSRYLVHFTKGDNAYRDLLSILHAGNIEAGGVFGIAQSKLRDRSDLKSVCFSETPLPLIKRISEGTSSYGVVFHKFHCQRNGVNPILYAYAESGLPDGIRTLIARASDDLRDPIWQLSTFIDEPKYTDNYKYKFEWEREWRKLGDYGFNPDDVAFLILPEEYHENAKGFFEQAEADEIGPNYTCPFIDPLWDPEIISDILNAS